MKGGVRRWLRRLYAAFISGGAAAVVSGFATMGFAPDKFNLVSMEGLAHLLVLIFANFTISGLLGIFLYLKTEPLPPEGNGTDHITKP